MITPPGFYPHILSGPLMPSGLFLAKSSLVVWPYHFQYGALPSIPGLGPTSSYQLARSPHCTASIGRWVMLSVLVWGEDNLLMLNFSIMVYFSIFSLFPYYYSHVLSSMFILAFPFLCFLLLLSCLLFFCQPLRPLWAWP